MRIARRKGSSRVRDAIRHGLTAIGRSVVRQQERIDRAMRDAGLAHLRAVPQPVIYHPRRRPPSR